MAASNNIDLFLSPFSEDVVTHVHTLRSILMANLPGITEQLDISAKMIAYCYGQKYTELICVIIPSKKGLKLGFNRGTELADPGKMLEGTGKISRYVIIHSEKQIRSVAVKKLITGALKLYQKKVQTS
jgi:hypothetical protein